MSRRFPRKSLYGFELKLGNRIMRGNPRFQEQWGDKYEEYQIPYIAASLGDTVIGSLVILFAFLLSAISRGKSPLFEVSYIFYLLALLPISLSIIRYRDKSRISS